ncbi:hypothetical protein NADFUDRAFT_49435 [Nadsonia fulvescens var. elongata DSM 6958]|uniref:Uncharacterized protein n=1 Tax=Nadsonia fulvescens var. elongata DSM 6958 TaxID=857566 RepID=A0A1E3PP29_9ASCO|nr:hypothetical protein NADFUDRAFT_49435 [Nadsonia fulvescens var. elongata DSM 6958]
MPNGLLSSRWAPNGDLALKAQAVAKASTTTTKSATPSPPSTASSRETRFETTPRSTSIEAESDDDKDFENSKDNRPLSAAALSFAARLGKTNNTPITSAKTLPEEEWATSSEEGISDEELFENELPEEAKKSATRFSGMRPQSNPAGQNTSRSTGTTNPKTQQGLGTSKWAKPKTEQGPGDSKWAKPKLEQGLSASKWAKPKNAGGGDRVKISNEQQELSEEAKSFATRLSGMRSDSFLVSEQTNGSAESTKYKTEQGLSASKWAKAATSVAPTKPKNDSHKNNSRRAADKVDNTSHSTERERNRLKKLNAPVRDWDRDTDRPLSETRTNNNESFNNRFPHNNDNYKSSHNNSYSHDKPSNKVAVSKRTVVKNRQPKPVEEHKKEKPKFTEEELRIQYEKLMSDMKKGTLDWADEDEDDDWF